MMGYYYLIEVKSIQHKILRFKWILWWLSPFTVHATSWMVTFCRARTLILVPGATSLSHSAGDCMKGWDSLQRPRAHRDEARAQLGVRPPVRRVTESTRGGLTRLQDQVSGAAKPSGISGPRLRQGSCNPLSIRRNSRRAPLGQGRVRRESAAGRAWWTTFGESLGEAAGVPTGGQCPREPGPCSRGCWGTPLPAPQSAAVHLLERSRA